MKPLAIILHKTNFPNGVSFQNQVQQEDLNNNVMI
jgi:hypothetical protein